MTTLLFLLCFGLLVYVIRKFNRLTDEITRLAKAVKNLQNDVYGRETDVSDESAEPEETPPPPIEPTPEPTMPIPVKSEPEPAVTYAQSAQQPIDEEMPLPEEPDPPPVEPPDIKSSTTSSILYEKWLIFKSNVDWEQFTSVKLFAWLGGLAIIIAAGFFVKLYIERNPISPEVRLAFSALTGIGLIIGARFFSEKKYSILRHAVAATGIGILYSVVFAATLYYEFLSPPLGFGMLAVISAAAFVLAVFYKSRAVSILGALGAYITPLMVDTGQGSLIMLFGYLAIVNLGLYQVARQLSSRALVLVAAAGTIITLGLGTGKTFVKLDSIVIAIIWILNTCLFSFFLGHSNADPDDDLSSRWAGILTFLSSLFVSASILMVSLVLAKPGFSCMLVVTVALAAAMVLAWRNHGWYAYVIPYAAVSFIVALIWVLFDFNPAQLSVNFLLLLVYGAIGGLGPVLLVWRYGLDKSANSWFKVFPLAIVCISLAVMLNQPAVSVLFWPLLLVLELIGIGISVIFRYFAQVVLLVLLLVIGALNWIFHVPADMLGIGFFLFIIGAGVLLCAGLFLLIKHLPDIVTRLHLDTNELFRMKGSASEMPDMAHWLAAAPAAGVCVLLAASFLVNYPHYPHPGMATLICFLALILFAVRRVKFEIAGVAALLGTAAAQAVFIFHPTLGPPVYHSALLWSGALFLCGLIVPFIFFQPYDQWKRIWNGWALFEAAQAIFILYTTRVLWPADHAQWVPLALALLKLPLVAILLRRLHGRPERNAILAFHGGVLLFYLSTLPVLVLDHGWIGLTFVFEAAALLWLNRRIEHPGLRWVAWVMAPVGLLILTISLPLLKTAESLPVINSATLSVFAAVLALAFAVRQAGYPQRLLKDLDLPNHFMWLTVATGFLLVNLTVADLFAQPGTRFTVWPGKNFVQWACYALSWVGLGGLLLRLTRLSQAIRRFGFYLLSAGTLFMILLPLLLPEAALHMRPFFNKGLALYLPLLGFLYYIFYKEPYNDPRNLNKNILLALFLTATFITIKFQKGIVIAPGYPFTLLMSQTPVKAAASAAGWMIYGFGLHIWPKRLDRPFRLAGMVLILLGIFKALILPFRFQDAFAQMTPVINSPLLVYLFCLAALTFLTIRKWDQNWILKKMTPKPFWGITLAIFSFCVLNIEIASIFAIKGRSFSMMPHGSLSMQLAYSIGWLLFAISLMVVGIRWEQVRVRWAAIILFGLTACKIFLLDVSSLDRELRVASLLGLGVSLYLVSFLYQRFLSEGNKNEN